MASHSGNLPAYDSYKGLNVEGKWVVVLRYTPENLSEDKNRQLMHYASPRYKVFLAKDHEQKELFSSVARIPKYKMN